MSVLILRSARIQLLKVLMYLTVSQGSVQPVFNCMRASIFALCWLATTLVSRLSSQLLSPSLSGGVLKDGFPARLHSSHRRWWYGRAHMRDRSSAHRRASRRLRSRSMCPLAAIGCRVRKANLARRTRAGMAMLARGLALVRVHLQTSSRADP